MAGQREYVTVNPSVTHSTANETQQSQLSPSLLSGYSQQNTSANSENINNIHTNTTTSFSNNTRMSSRPVSRDTSVARDRSQSVDKQGTRGRPRTTAKDTIQRSRSRSSSVKSRSNNKGPVSNVSMNGAGQAGPGPGPGHIEQTPTV